MHKEGHADDEVWGSAGNTPNYDALRPSMKGMAKKPEPAKKKKKKGMMKRMFGKRDPRAVREERQTQEAVGVGYSKPTRVNYVPTSRGALKSGPEGNNVAPAETNAVYEKPKRKRFFAGRGKKN